MKLAILCLCVLCVALADGRIFTRNDLQIAHKNMAGNRAQIPHSSAKSSNQSKQRTLFARRGQYERQRIHVPKPKVVPSSPSAPSPKRRPKPVKPRCSQLTQSCVPQDGCCDRWAACHCHFFNAICHCRRTNPNHTQKT
ncbi:agouti-signaling protein-like [Sphaeramia orbicularis]|uniref:Agouti-signaling protein-like n=1 Tax=Sphaeramia orbicularis TaxID=375764 RepID=A0A673CDG8_9TELE|nr:agouti-signaling protein-like [Sphaeramia orbicularis]